MKVAFIGLGHMGTPVSRNIPAAGHDLGTASMPSLSAPQE